MKVQCDRKALYEGFQMASAVVATRSPKPVLQCVLLQARDDVLTLLGTDLEIGVRYAVGSIKVEQEGEVLVPADRLGAILRETADETISLERSDQTCHLRTSDSHFAVFGMDPQEFPQVPAFEAQPQLQIRAEKLKELIHQTLFAAARENTRYAINGVLWQVRGRKLTLVATDGRRLAKARGDLITAASGEVDAIVPAKTMHLLERVLQDPQAKVSVHLTADRLMLQVGQATISSGLVEGHFPKYEDVIPRDADKKVGFQRLELLSAVRRAALLTSEESKGVRMSFNTGGLVLSSRAPEAGEAEIRMKIDYQAEPLEIGFNPQFLIDALRVVDVESVVFELKQPNKPGLLRAGSDFLYVVMPVNLS